MAESGTEEIVAYFATEPEIQGTDQFFINTYVIALSVFYINLQQ